MLADDDAFVVVPFCEDLPCGVVICVCDGY